MTFSDSSVNREALRRKAYNYRWAEQEPDVIPLTAADPDFPAPPVVRDALEAYVAEGYFSYGPKLGLPEFVDAIVTSLRSRKAIAADETQVLPIDGAARAMFVMARMVLRPGDQAIVFDPVDYLFKSAVEAAGGIPVYSPVDPATGCYDIDGLDALVTPRTRMIGVCNAHNPLGRVLRRDEAEAIAAFADRHDLWIMNDEIWSDIIYSDPKQRPFVSMHALPADLRNKTVTIYGFSKTFSLAGLRAGFVVCPNGKTRERFSATADMPSTAGGISTLSQIAGTAALRDGWPWVDDFVAHLQEQRDHAVTRLNSIPGVRCSTPEGTYVLFPDVSAFGMTSAQIASRVLEVGRVAVVPGTPEFFGPGGAGHIRICFATSRSILAEGLDRLEYALSRVQSA